MKRIIKMTAAAVMALLVFCGCGSVNAGTDAAGQSGSHSVIYREETGNNDKTDDPVPASTTAQAGATEAAQGTALAEGVTVNGNAVEHPEFAYTYNAAFGHYFLTAFKDDGDSVAFMAVLPEELCVSGAEYSGADITSGGILFDIVVVGEDYYFEYNSGDNPEVFDDLRVKIDSVELYGAARFEISGSVSVDGRIARIAASGQSEYVEANNQSGGESAGNNYGTCLYCGGSGVCFLCHGLGYTAWGGYSDRIDCNSCNGLGYCYYCQGTGIQVYSVRGVKINP